MSSPGDQAVYEAVLATVRAGRQAALATIVSTRGSTPRKAGSRMLVDPETGLVGTVGGGCGEAEVIDVAQRVMEDGVPRLVKVDLTEDMLGWSPAVCGGIMDIFVERVSGGETGATTTRAAPATEGVAAPPAERSREPTGERGVQPLSVQDAPARERAADGEDGSPA